MAQKSKKTDNCEASVKIVGINHALNLHIFLSKDGWKQEKFTDVAFICSPEQGEEFNLDKPQRKLRANRSVLAAASPFFAKMLPDYQQEDLVITVEYSYEEMFLILEYVYSGRLVCSLDKKERILTISKELKINTTELPEHQQEIAVDEISSSLPPVITNEIRTLTEPTMVLDHARSDNIGNDEGRLYVEPEITRLPSLNVKKYPRKMSVHGKTTLLSRNAARINLNQNLQKDDFTLAPPNGRETLFDEALHHIQEFDRNTVVEQSILKNPLTPLDSTQCNLAVYLSQTWCYGIYSSTPQQQTQTVSAKSSMECAKLVTQQQIKPQNIQALASRPVNVLVHNATARHQLPDTSEEVFVVPHSIKTSSGLISKTGVNLDFSTVQSQITESTIRKTFAEKEADNTDAALAKHFLQEEMRVRHKLLMRSKMLSDKLSQCKEVARTILTSKRRIELNLVATEPANKALMKIRKQTQCEQCGKMVLASRLHIHRKIHSGVKSHLCDLCGRAFIMKAYLNAHIRINHRGLERPKRFMCSSCGYTCDQKHKLEVHERIHTDERPFECQYCDKKFREKGALVRHIRTHTGEKPYACDICGTAYAARDTYVQHYRRKHARPDGTSEQRQRMRNSKEMIYRCDMCDKGFYRLLAFEKHRASHTGGEVSIRCSQPDCTYTYSDMAQLREHMSLIHPEKTYACSTCSKVFLSKQNLAYHQSKHDPTRGFHCSMCPTSLTTKASLIAHEKLHTRETPFECSVCNARFHSAYLMKIHARTHQPSVGKRKRVRQPAGNSGEGPSGGARTSTNYF